MHEKVNRLERLRSMLDQVGKHTNKVAAEGDKSTDDYVLESISGDKGLIQESLHDIRTRKFDNIDTDRQMQLEAIVMPFYRPVVDIINNKVSRDQLTQEWRHIRDDDAILRRVEQTFRSIGRIEIPNHPSLPYAGTGFVVSKDDNNNGILMTNRHVAEVFTNGVGEKKLKIEFDQSVHVDFLKENNQDSSDPLAVEKVLMIHPYWDMALLKVKGLASDQNALKLSTLTEDKLIDREVVTVGYPGFDPTGDWEYQQTQSRIFRNTYYVKRFQPGLMGKNAEVKSFGNSILAATHDCSTAGGNSGSAVILIPQTSDEEVEITGLHFAGKYLEANYAVPTRELAGDNRVVDTGIFEKNVAPLRDFYGPMWSDVDAGLSCGPYDNEIIGHVTMHTPSKPILNTPVDSKEEHISWTIPLNFIVGIGQPRISVESDKLSSTSIVTSSPEPEGMFGGEPKFSIDELIKKFSLPSLSKTKFNWRTALSTAVASSIIYQKNVIVEELIKKELGFETCEFIDVGDSQCFVSSWKDVALVAFRGTESVGDWLGNLNVLSKESNSYGTVHLGFYNGFEKINSKLEKRLKKIKAERIILTGHSLGGALATIAAADWNKNLPIKSIYTFGQPAVGKKDFISYFFSNLNNKLYRFVNDDDIVARVPPFYQHVGELFHFNASGGLYPKQETLNGMGPKMLSEIEFDRLRAILLEQKIRRQNSELTETLRAQKMEGLLPSIKDHSIEEYITKIEVEIKRIS